MLTGRAMLCVLMASGILSACSTWRHAPEGLAPNLPPKERREVWVRGQHAVVRAITVRSDTVRAITVCRRPWRCADSVVWLTAAIDSVRIARPDAKKTLRAAGGVVLFGVFLYVMRQVNGVD